MIFLGETFSGFVTVHNDSQDMVKEVSLKVNYMCTRHCTCIRFQFAQNLLGRGAAGVVLMSTKAAQGVFVGGGCAHPVQNTVGKLKRKLVLVLPPKQYWLETCMYL